MPTGQTSPIGFLPYTQSQVNALLPSASNLLALGSGGTGQTTAQAAIDALTAVSSATNEYVLTKDTSTGHATWKTTNNKVSALTASYTVNATCGITEGTGVCLDASGNAWQGWPAAVVGVSSQYDTNASADTQTRICALSSSLYIIAYYGASRSAW